MWLVNWLGGLDIHKAQIKLGMLLRPWGRLNLLIKLDAEKSSLPWKLLSAIVDIDSHRYPAKNNSTSFCWILHFDTYYTGWRFQPLWKIWKSVGMILPDNYMEKYSKSSKPPTSIFYGKSSSGPQQLFVNYRNKTPSFVQSSAGLPPAERRSFHISECTLANGTVFIEGISILMLNNQLDEPGLDNIR